MEDLIYEHFSDLVINTELSTVSLLIDVCFTFITSYDLLQALGILSVIAFLLFVRSQYLRVEQVRNQCTVSYEPRSCMDFYNYNNTWGGFMWGIDFTPYLFQHATTSRLKTFWGPKSHQKQPQCV